MSEWISDREYVTRQEPTKTRPFLPLWAQVLLLVTSVFTTIAWAIGVPISRPAAVAAQALVATYWAFECLKTWGTRK